MPLTVKLFEGRAEAIEFASKWKPQPWWVIPQDFCIVPVEAVMEIAGWKEITE